MISEFLLDTVSRLAISEKKYLQMVTTFPREACEYFEYGKNSDGYWTGEHVINQVSKLFQ